MKKFGVAHFREFQRRSHWAPLLAWSVSQSNDFGFLPRPPTASSTVSLYHHRRHHHHPLAAPGPSKGSSLRPFHTLRHSPLYRRHDAHFDRPGDARRCVPQSHTRHQPGPAVPSGTRYLQPYTCEHRTALGGPCKNPEHRGDWNIADSWQPPQEQADLWMALRDRMTDDWKQLTLQEKKAGA